MKKFDACWFGRVSYANALLMMDHFAQRVASGEPEVLLLMEHPPVITMGRSASLDNLLLTKDEYLKRGFELHRIGRGGDVTYHGPGQLMGYPIMKVGRMVTRHVDHMFDTLTELLGAYGIRSAFESDHPGLWVGTDKVAAVGVEIKDEISRHGFALNVHRQGSGFELIVACGLTHRGTIYMSDLAKPPPLDEMAQDFAFRYSNTRRQPLNWREPEEFLRDCGYEMGDGSKA